MRVLGGSTARPGEFGPLGLGPFRVWPPVVLAPMAGVTNAPFRQLCRRFGAGLYLSEMITARALVEGHAKTLELSGFGPDESPRSLQLYGVDPLYVGEAVAWLVGEGRVDHIDLNFGCPVRKVTRRGGGAALPLKTRLLRNIVREAVRRAGDVPVTVKFRLGIDRDHETYLDTGRIAEEEGCAAVALHARTAAQLYAGEASWEKIGELKSAVRSIPVLGNGDIWEARDALRMMRVTGCDGVVVGRGCLGRPWLFRELAAAFDGQEPPPPPDLGGVARVMLEHARLLADWFDEAYAIRGFRKHATWYTKGFRNSKELRRELAEISSVRALERALAGVDPHEPFPAAALRIPRGKKTGTQRVALPDGYLQQLDDPAPPTAAAESSISGG
ncbi:MAG: tRNA dihydrouridine synthase DusB [Myxococcota bacterium]